MTPWVVGLYIVLICSIRIVLTIIVFVLSIGGIVLVIIIMVGIVCGIIVIDLIIVVIVIRACVIVLILCVIGHRSIVLIVIVSIIIIISCIMGVMAGAVLCRWMHRSGGCWFFRGYSRHPRVGFFYYRGGEDVRVAEVL